MSLNDELRSNGAVIDSFKRTVDHCDLEAIPRLVKVVLTNGAWRHRYCSYAPRVEAKFDRFADFITTAPIEGCGWQLDHVHKLLQKTEDEEALALWRQATTAEKHVHKADGDNITIKPERGTARAYILDRLTRERPDLFERVKTKELSANAAAIEAGFRKKPVPLDQLCTIARKLPTPERLAAIEYLTHLIRLDVGPEAALSKINCVVHDMLHGNPPTPALTKVLKVKGG